VVKSVFFGNGYERQVLGTGGFSWPVWKANMALAGMSFLNPGWALALRGVKTAGGRGTLWLLALTALHGGFWARYFVADQATFGLPTLGVGAIWLGLGAVGCRRRTLLALLATGIVLQVGVPPWLAAVAGDRADRARVLPFRDEARYWLVPWKQNETSAQRFVKAVEEQMPPGDVLAADSTAAAPLMAVCAVDKKMRTWRLVSPWTGDDAATLCEWAEQRRLFVVSPVAGYTPDVLLERYDFEREGVLWRVKERKQGDGAITIH
jgi:hypothetical protein